MAAASRSVCQAHGSSRSSSWALIRPETMRSSTLVSHANGSTPFSFAVATRLATIAQWRAPPSEPVVLSRPSDDLPVDHHLGRIVHRFRGECVRGQPLDACHLCGFITRMVCGRAICEHHAHWTRPVHGLAAIPATARVASLGQTVVEHGAWVCSGLTRLAATAAPRSRRYPPHCLVAAGWAWPDVAGARAGRVLFP